MQLTLPTLQSMLAGMAASAQSACTQLLDLTIGSPARALLFASAQQWSWQQSNIYRVLAASRLATSSGTDIDTFIADYGCPPREAATFATGLVTLARFVPATAATVPVGASVRTGDGSLTYVIGADPTNPTWSAAIPGYVVPVGTASITVPVECTTAGSQGNVIAGAISLLGSAIPGIDTVNNGAAFVDAADGETDAQVQLRFALYIRGLSKATLTAVESAIADVQAGLVYSVTENVDEQGSFRPGHFVCVVDDGSGSPPATLLSSVYAAVDAVRPVCSTFSVQPPAVNAVNVALSITVSSGNKASLFTAVSTAVTAYVDATPVGGTVSLTRIAAAAYATNSTIVNVSAITINGVAADLVAPTSGVTKASLVVVS